MPTRNHYDVRLARIGFDCQNGLQFHRLGNCTDLPTHLCATGGEYPGPQARAHLEKKLNYLEGKNIVNSAEDFIDLVATKSSVSGRAYEVRCSEGVEPASIWLKRELQRQR